MAANMSRKEILGKVYKMIPPMLENFHKGEHETEHECFSMTNCLLIRVSRSTGTSGSHRRQ